MVEQLLAAVKNEKMSAGVLGVVLIFAYYAVTWANDQHDQYLRRDEHSREHHEVSNQITDLTAAVTEYIEDSKIVVAGQLIRDKEIELRLAMATGGSEADIDHLRTEIEQAKRYKNCLIDKRPNCKHLRPPE